MLGVASECNFQQASRPEGGGGVNLSENGVTTLLAPLLQPTGTKFIIGNTPEAAPLSQNFSLVSKLPYYVRI